MNDYDFFQFDSNGDGFPDILIERADTNNSGQFDTFVVQHDVNGDGLIDVVKKAHDYNQDGRIDSITTHTDTNQDGRFDQVTKVYDSTGDGQMDKLDTYVDVTGTGKVDYHASYSFPDASLQSIPPIGANGIAGTVYTELENYEPYNNNPECVSGNPEESMTYWECQGDTNRCALYAQKFVIEELSPGIQIDIDDFAQVAKDNGWFTEEGGTSFLNMNNMLDYYGIENEMLFHQTVNDIEECLNAGGKVIVSIDSNEIWFGEENNIFSPSSSSNHAVEVIGIDRSDPDYPMVILNDSGSPNGKGEMIPLVVFEGAWEDGDCQMIKCYPA